jgi:CubicO group peptidase (beta-lactamase class C family)
MLLTPRQMLAFGEVYLHHGVTGGKPVIPSTWVDASFVPRTQSPISGHKYGYGWWMEELGGQMAYYAWGFGGQYVFVIPSLDAVVVTTSSVALGDDRREHRNAVYDLIERDIIGALVRAR